MVTRNSSAVATQEAVNSAAVAIRKPLHGNGCRIWEALR